MPRQPVIDKLRDEHRIMQAMFTVIDEEMEEFAASGMPDFERLLAAVEYCHAYPGARHHPRENVVYHVLQARNAAVADRIGDLEAEHRILTDYTRRFKAAIEQVLSQENVARGRLATLAEDYTQFLKRHMATEESAFFPAAMAHLTADDWIAVNAGIAELNETPPDPATETRFAKLEGIVLGVTS